MLIETTPLVSPHSAAVSVEPTSKASNYVYLHLRGDTGEVFYVGKGIGRRAWHTFKRSRWWRAIYEKHGREVLIVKDGMSEPCALSLERMLIAKFKGQTCNLTDGGQGISGYRHTPEAIEVMREKKVGYRPKRLSPEHYKEIGAARRGTKMSDEPRAKMRAAKVGRQLTPEWRANLSRAQKGRKHSPEHVKNQADAQRGKKLSEEHKAAIGNFHRGKKLSEEHKAVFSHPVLCSNGMSFPSTAEAARWLRSNGFPKASGTNIRYNVVGTTKSAYGFTWSRI